MLPEKHTCMTDRVSCCFRRLRGKKFTILGKELFVEGVKFGV